MLIPHPDHAAAVRRVRKGESTTHSDARTHHESTDATTPISARGGRRWEKLLADRLLRRITHGSLTVRYWDSDVRHYGRDGCNPSASVIINNPAVIRKALHNLSLAFGEGYARRDIEAEEADLDSLFEISHRNRSAYNTFRIARLPCRTEHTSPRVQRSQIKRHYDVGNDYYELFLDPTLTYSCAYFEHDDDSLEVAQSQKIDYVLRKLAPRPGQRLLDIGCGWGYLAVRAAQRYQVAALGITLSDEQLAGARALAQREGVSHLVDFQLMHYLDLEREIDRGFSLDRSSLSDSFGVQIPLDRFDRIVSVGMFEHVGRANYARYLRLVHALLAPGGVGLLHTITNQKIERNDAWVDRYIFPGGQLPTVAEVEYSLSQADLWSVDRENLWQHYIRTLALWRENHRSQQDRIIEKFGEIFYRTRDLWLAGSQAGFQYRNLGLSQFLFTKGKPAAWPLTRRYVYGPGHDTPAPAQ